MNFQGDNKAIGTSKDAARKLKSRLELSGDNKAIEKSEDAARKLKNRLELLHRDNIPISILNKGHCYSSVYDSAVNDTAEPSVKISSAKPVDTCSDQDSQQ